MRKCDRHYMWNQHPKISKKQQVLDFIQQWCKEILLLLFNRIRSQFLSLHTHESVYSHQVLLNRMWGVLESFGISSCLGLFYSLVNLLILSFWIFFSLHASLSVMTGLDPPKTHRIRLTWWIWHPSHRWACVCVCVCVCKIFKCFCKKSIMLTKASLI